MRGPRRWGGLARRGAGRATSASDAWRAAGRDVASTGGAADRGWQPEEWIDKGELRDEAADAVGRSRRPADGPAPARKSRRAAPAGASTAGGDGDARPADAVGRSRRPADGPAPARRSRRAAPAGAPTAGGDGGDGAGDDVRGAVAPNRLARFESRLKDATDAFRRERYEDARRTLRPLAEQAPRAASVRELYGLTLYRLGRWAQAARELEAFRTQTGGTEQHPVLADCYRALGRYAEVEELWEELRAASPSAELVAEGRIVAAGALADRGRLDEAIELLAAGSKPTKRAKLHHLRVAYALADLYERAGDLPRARELFGLVAASDPDFVDVQARLRALR
jgi:tetratricopeptide (TPR) repeat protein